MNRIDPPVTIATTLENQGRIPAPSKPWPISPERFTLLSRAWQPFGMWLSLWDCDGKAILWDEHPPRFWRTLWSRRSELSRSLAEHARQSLSCPAAPTKGALTNSPAAESSSTSDSAFPDLGPFLSDLGFIAVPVRQRNRVTGVVLAGVVMSDLHGEAFVRLCNACGLDHSSTASMGHELPRWNLESVRPLVRSLRLAVEQAHELDVVHEESAVLTQHLENTYEELNLIYRISAQMGLPQRPQVLLEHVGEQVTVVSRAATVAFVLTELGTDHADRNVPETFTTHSLHDRVVQVGWEQTSPGKHAKVDRYDPVDLIRLAESLQLDPVTTPNQLLINNAAQLPELAWAGSWLHHLVALPLWHKERLLGVMLSINCSDDGDFTSVDVQLFRAVADRLTAFLENQRLYDDLADLLMAMLHAVVNSVDAKDPYTYGHSERVAFLSRALARAANLSPTECERVYLAGLLHDLGKIGVPDAILSKPGKLTMEEFDTLKKHPEIGVRILSPVRQMRDLLPGVLYHHERFDGRGYPEGLSGDDIPLLGRIICLADCFDAMTTNRTYRAALPLHAAIAEVRRCAGTQFDPHLAALFLDLDLEQLFQEARSCLGSDATMAHMGALHAVLGRQLTH